MCAIMYTVYMYRKTCADDTKQQQDISTKNTLRCIHAKDMEAQLDPPQGLLTHREKRRTYKIETISIMT